MEKQSTYQIGRKGEDLATKYLEDLGYRIITRNFIYNKKEIDIIAWDKNTIVFVEVKERATDYFGQPYEAVNKQKQKNIISAADNYIRRYNIDAEARFDVISIVVNQTNEPKIVHIPNAFAPTIM